MCLCRDRIICFQFDLLSSDCCLWDIVCLDDTELRGNVVAKLRVRAGHYLLAVDTRKSGRVYSGVDLQRGCTLFSDRDRYVSGMDYSSVNQSGTETYLDDALGGLFRYLRVGNGDRVLESRPTLMGYYDATYTKSNSLSQNSQDIIALLDGEVTVTTYTNILDRDFWETLPESINRDKEVLRPYVRFKPDMKLRYVYFYDNANNKEMDEQYPDMNDKERAERICENYGLPFSIFRSPEEMKGIEDLSGEGNRTIRVIERENGQKAYLRFYYHGDGEVIPWKVRLRLRSDVW